MCNNKKEYSYRFFENRACQYFPCHKGQENFNCLFCYCPFYMEEKCPGNPVWLDLGRTILKDCSNCTYPHKPENYDAIMNWLKKKIDEREVSEEIKKKAQKL